MTIDTGGETNVIDDITARDLQCELQPTYERALMADGVTELHVLGKTQAVLTRNSKTFTINALVCEMAKPTILAGMPFLISHDIAIRPAKSEIILDGSDVVKYDASSSKIGNPSSSRRVTSFVVRSPANKVILPGENMKFEVPNNLSKESAVAIEPRHDNSYQKSLSHPWPPPKIHQVTEGMITVSNNSYFPISVKKMNTSVMHSFR